MSNDSTINRPPLRYHGSKWRLARWILKHFPSHDCYVEPYGGGAAVLLQKQRSWLEVYNDKDGDLAFQWPGSPGFGETFYR